MELKHGELGEVEETKFCKPQLFVELCLTFTFTFNYVI